MFCRKCGVQLGENGICPKCGFVYEPMYKEYMDSWFEQGKTLSLPSMDSVAHTKTQMRFDETPTVQTANNNYQQPSAYTQYYQQNPMVQQTVQKKSNLSLRAWFAPVTLIVFVLIYGILLSIASPILAEAIMDAAFDGFNEAYISSISTTYSIVFTCVEVIFLPLLSVLLYNLAFINVEKKKKKASSALILAPIVAYWVMNKISSIINNVLTMWLNAKMIEQSAYSICSAICNLLFLTIFTVVSFFICKSALKKLENSWQ